MGLECTSDTELLVAALGVCTSLSWRDAEESLGMETEGFPGVSGTGTVAGVTVGLSAVCFFCAFSRSV